jgi:hypothetical protein
MSPIMRVRLAFVFVVVAALLTATRAVADNPKSTGTVQLSPVAADEPDASGVAKVTLVGRMYPLRASGAVACKGLMPNAEYVVMINALLFTNVGWGNYGYVPYTYHATYTTDARGSIGWISYSVPCGPIGPAFGVCNAATGELVLETAGFTYP